MSFRPIACSRKDTECFLVRVREGWDGVQVSLVVGVGVVGLGLGGLEWSAWGGSKNSCLGGGLWRPSGEGVIV